MKIDTVVKLPFGNYPVLIVSITNLIGSTADKKSLLLSVDQFKLAHVFAIPLTVTRLLEM